MGAMPVSVDFGLPVFLLGQRDSQKAEHKLCENPVGYHSRSELKVMIVAEKATDMILGKEPLPPRTVPVYKPEV